MNLIEIGKIVNTHGVRGELKFNPWCDDIYDLLELEDVWLCAEKRLKITQSRVHKTHLLIKFEEIDTFEKAEALKGKILYADRAFFTLEPGRYFVTDLIGLDVFNIDTDEFLGKIKDILKNGAADIYELENGRMFPAAPDFIKSVDLQKKEMKIKVLEGIFDDI